MKDVKEIFENFLSKFDDLSEPRLGPKKKDSKKIEDEDRIRLEKIIAAQIMSNNKIVVIYLVILSAIFLIGFAGVILTMKNFDSSAAILIVLLTKFVLLTLPLKQLHKFWREKSVLEISFALARELPPDKLLTVIRTIYWGAFRKQT